MNICNYTAAAAKSLRKAKEKSRVEANGFLGTEDKRSCREI